MDIPVDRIPQGLRNLRACLLCSLVKSFEQFEVDGCDNCEFVLGMRGNREMIFDCTSSNFDGLIGVTQPDESWAAKWLRIPKFKPGTYAISVSGKLPQTIYRELKSRNIPYKSRDRAS
ncbi:transcription elongation factor SPT4-like [Panonychus citri]|uniref:transcription elongation factor SPT4-like n=1 Tax=Panonychus citri TaxID=50023 RepID=UPI0023081CA4|nr:transcription elongation factor SPT4-like [Panonychus citri]